MGKMLVIFVISSLCVLFIYYLVAKTAIGVYDETAAPIKELVGEKVIFQGDTLSVIDYSFLKSTVTLSNGTVVNDEFAKNLDKVK
jgi:hypothetical protein